MNSNEAHEKLQEFMLANCEYIQWDKIRKFAPSLYDTDKSNWLKEVVTTCNPDAVLENCFGRGRLHYLAEKNFGISLDSELGGRRFIGAILRRLGFTTESSDPRVGIGEVCN